MRRGLAIWVLLVLGFGCKDQGPEVTRESCGKVADHIADLVMAHLTAHPDELWDSVTSAPGDSGLPKEVTKESLPSFMATPEGKTWLMQRRGHVRTGTEQGVGRCVTTATPKQVQCLLGAKSKDDVNACDTRK